MSGLERFQGSSDWMQRFKSLLSTNRESKTPTKDLDSSAESSVCLELTEELQTILQEKIPKIMTTSFKADNKENMNPVSLSSNEITSNISQSKRVSVFDDSIMNPSFVEGGSASSFEITNISFSAIEQACNKSISDPDSTIHKYVEQIKKNNDSKFSQIVDEDDISGDNETIDRLIRDLEAEQIKCANIEKETMPRFSNDHLMLRQTFGLADQTQLGDIEEPSALWETTVADNDGARYHISPTKMVGLLRPSTILEESASSNLSNTTIESFDTAQKLDSDNTNAQSDVTSQYETACETTRSDLSNIKNDIEVSNTHHLPSFMQKYKFFDTDINTSDSSDSSTKESSDSISKSNVSSRNSTIDSLQEDDQGNVIHIHKEDIKKENMTEKSKLEISSITIEISDDESDIEPDEKTCNKSKEHLNEGFSMQNIEETSLCENVVDLTLKEDLEISHEFNDTLEEVEYIMKHGMEMLKNSATKPKLIDSVHTTSKETIVTPSKSGNMTPISNSPAISRLSSGFYSNSSSKITSIEKHKFNKSPTPFSHKVFSPRPNINSKPLRNSPLPFNKFMTKPNSVNKNPPSASKETFRKPVLLNNMSKIPQSKLISNVKKSIYSDVISPVGAYIKKTPVCPTESRIKETTIKSLDYGQVTGKANVQYHPPKRFELKKGNAPSLPQKFYKSAEYRCVVDERTPLNIPGGESIHKYLKSALAPAIVRHDGKMKMGSPMKYAEKHNADVNKTVDSTMTDLADLSTMSGDVSIYTLKDAQKFTHGREKNFEYKKKTMYVGEKLNNI